HQPAEAISQVPHLSQSLTDSTCWGIECNQVATVGKLAQEAGDIDIDHGKLPSGTCHGCRSRTKRPAFTAGSVSVRAFASSSVATLKTNIPRKYPSSPNGP